MTNRIFGIPGSCALALLLSCLAPAGAQTKPAESASKVKKVMLYNKVGGWVRLDQLSQTKAAFEKLAAEKGFQLTQIASDADLTLDYLKQFQVIVWNNNTNGGASVSNPAARQAILDYVGGGGGWMLLHAAADHQGTWPGLTTALGTAFTQHGKAGAAEIQLDGEAKSHRELKWMLAGFPDAFELHDSWLSFLNTVRALPGMTVVATTRAVGDSANVVVPMGDGSPDHPYIWAHEVGQGRLIYNGLGFDLGGLLEQQDSIVPKLYWENLRYAAGDYQNGCANPASAYYDPAARIHVDASCSTVGVRAPRAGSGMALSHGGTRIRVEAPGGPLQARLRDLRGALVWERKLPAGTAEFALDGAVRPGVYHLELRGSEGVSRRRLALP